MKIEHGVGRKQFNNFSHKNTVNIDAENKFSSFLEQEEKEQSKEELNKLLKDIEKQSKILVNSKKTKDLLTYKELIKKYMDEVVDRAIYLEEKYGYDNLGRKKRYKIVKEIDQKLIELTNNILENEEDTLTILEKMGDIQGLLINLYY